MHQFRWTWTFFTICYITIVFISSYITVINNSVRKAEIKIKKFKKPIICSSSPRNHNFKINKWDLGGHRLAAIFFFYLEAQTNNYNNNVIIIIVTVRDWITNWVQIINHNLNNYLTTNKAPLHKYKYIKGETMLLYRRHILNLGIVGKYASLSQNHFQCEGQIFL